jgi:hypothetical protein
LGKSEEGEINLMRVARMSQRDRIDFVDVAGEQRGKGFLGIVIHVFLQQSDVVQFLNLQLNAADAIKVTSFSRLIRR